MICICASLLIEVIAGGVFPLQHSLIDFERKKKNGCCIELYSRGFMLTSLIYVKIYKVSVALIQFCCIFCRANDICKESKRQTISAEDVFKALEEIEFPEFVASLRTSLEG